MREYKSEINHIKSNLTFYMGQVEKDGIREVTLYGLDKISVLEESDLRAIEELTKDLKIGRKQVDDAFFLRNKDGKLGLVISW